jgi:hypothetical protein
MRIYWAAWKHYGFTWTVLIKLAKRTKVWAIADFVLHNFRNCQDTEIG